MCLEFRVEESGSDGWRSGDDGAGSEWNEKSREENGQDAELMRI